MVPHEFAVDCASAAGKAWVRLYSQRLTPLGFPASSYLFIVHTA